MSMLFIGNNKVLFTILSFHKNCYWFFLLINKIYYWQMIISFCTKKHFYSTSLLHFFRQSLIKNITSLHLPIFLFILIQEISGNTSRYDTYNHTYQ